MTNKHLPVRSISKAVWEAIDRLSGPARVLGIFHRVIDLAVNDEVIALVTPEIMNGPFHVIVDELPDWENAEVFPIQWQRNAVTIGDWVLETGPQTVIWDAHIPWDEIKIPYAALSTLRMIAIEFARLRSEDTPFARILYSKPEGAVLELQQSLIAFSDQRIRQAVQKIAGLGPGLTPSGDDFLSGIMLSAHTFGYPILGDQAHYLCQIIYETAAPRTNQISRAYLKSAMHGMADERWHTLLQSLTAAETPQIYAAAQSVVSFGETSGLDMLTGFIWMSDIAFGNHPLTRTEPRLSTWLLKEISKKHSSDSTHFYKKELVHEVY